MKVFYIANIRIPTEKAHGIQIVKMCEALALSGKKVTLIVPWRRNNIKENIFQFYNIKKTFDITTIPNIDLVWFGSVGFSIQSSIFALLSAFYVLIKKPDLVYSRNSSPLSILSFVSKIPFYYEIHVPRYNFLVKRAMDLCSKLIVISSGLKELVLKRGVSGGKIIIAPSGVEIEIFNTGLSVSEAKSMASLPQGSFIVGYMGSFKTLGYEKGLVSVFEALKLTESNVIFLAVGGRPIDVENYNTLANNFGVSERVILKGRFDQRQVAVFQSACDVLVMPFPKDVHYTRYMSPVKMFEYMSSNRPIVASDLPSIREILDDDKCFFFAPGNPYDLSKKIKEIVDNPNLAKDKYEAAFKAVSNFTWQKRIEKIFYNHPSLK